LRFVGCLFVIALLAAGAALAQSLPSGGPYRLEGTVDGGGARSTAAPYGLEGSIGQADAARLVGPPYVLDGGFWRGAPAAPTDIFFADGFE
jgi:hypothetical protein